MRHCPMSRHILNTGLKNCYNEKGVSIPCSNSGQDAEFHSGAAWPQPRFIHNDTTVHDRLTGLIWSRDVNPDTFPCTWLEALEAIRELNRESYCGFQDWRLPNRRELRSLMDYQTKKPSLPVDHPFINVFIHWYWTSTTAALHHAYAWCVHLEGARMFYGKKNQEALFWPVRASGNGVLSATGQLLCFDETGEVIDCPGSGQDGELRYGTPWPEPRFSVVDDTLILDRLSGLIWQQHTDLRACKLTWQQALQEIRELNTSDPQHYWRLPTINELESLVDAARHSPALPKEHPFLHLHEGYWSSTTSFFETDWAWVLYLDKGACGVGYKPDPTFWAWPVTENGCSPVGQSAAGRV